MHKKLWLLEMSNLSIFCRFLKLFDFSRKLPFQILVAMDRTGYGKLNCISGDRQLREAPLYQQLRWNFQKPKIIALSQVLFVF